MTPKEKAEELEQKFYDGCRITLAGASTIFKTMAKKLAIICVKEIMEGFQPLLDSRLNNDFDVLNQRVYWNEVLTELTK